MVICASEDEMLFGSESGKETKREVTSVCLSVSRRVLTLDTGNGGVTTPFPAAWLACPQELFSGRATREHFDVRPETRHLLGSVSPYEHSIWRWTIRCKFQVASVVRHATLGRSWLLGLPVDPPTPEPWQTSGTLHDHES